MNRKDFELLDSMDSIFRDTDKKYYDIIADKIEETFNMLFNTRYIGKQEYITALNSLGAYRQGGFELREARILAGWPGAEDDGHRERYICG
jgi:hypothetical protein